MLSGLFAAWESYPLPSNQYNVRWNWLYWKWLISKWFWLRFVRCNIIAGWNQSFESTRMNSVTDSTRVPTEKSTTFECRSHKENTNRDDRNSSDTGGPVGVGRARSRNTVSVGLCCGRLPVWRNETVSSQSGRCASSLSRPTNVARPVPVCGRSVDSRTPTADSLQANPGRKQCAASSNALIFIVVAQLTAVWVERCILKGCSFGQSRRHQRVQPRQQSDFNGEQSNHIVRTKSSDST